MRTAGRLRTRWEVTCGRCQLYDQPPGRTRAEVERHLLEVEGWRKRRPFGWVCARCLVELGERCGED